MSRRDIQVHLYFTYILSRPSPKPAAGAAPDATAGATASQPSRPPALLDNVSRRIQVWVKINYDTAMRFVAYAEIFITLRLFAGVLMYVFI